MRADRLLSLLLLLQVRGRMTALELAEKLEVSERTIYRDIEALCASGVPVYTEHGPGGGFELLDSYRTSLTGMTQDELRALFMVTVPGPLERLGISQELRSALLKLSAALPDARRSNEDQVRQRFYLDWDWWFHADEPAPHLRTIQQAVWEDRRLLVSYRLFFGSPIEDVPVEPYGLVAKAGVWYLVALREGRPRTYRVANMTQVKATEERFTRLPGFELERYWKEWCEQYEREHLSYLVKARVSPELLRFFPLYFGYGLSERVGQASVPDELGWRTVVIPFENLEAARGQILQCGGAIEVLEPEALRYSVADQAAHIARLYERRNS